MDNLNGNNPDLPEISAGGPAPETSADIPAPVTPSDIPTPETPSDAPAPEITPDAPAPEITPDAPAPEITPDAPAPEITPDAPAPEITPDAPAPETQPTSTTSPWLEEYKINVHPVPPQPDKKSYKPLFILIGIAAVAVIVTLVALFASGGSPVGRVVKAVQASAKAAGSSELYRTMSNIGNSGSISASVDLKELGYALDEDLRGDATVTLYTAAKDNASALNASVKVEKKQYDLTAWMNKDAFVVSSKALLGKNNYGLNLKNAAQTLPKSIFNPENDTAYSIGTEAYEILMELLTTDTDMKELQGDAEKAGKALIDVLLQSVQKNGEIEKDSEKLEFPGSTVKTSVVSIHLDGNALTAVAKDMLKAVRDNKDLRSMLDRTFALNESFENLENADYYYYYTPPTKEEQLEMFYDEIDELLEQLDEADPEELESTSLTLVSYISKANKQLVQLEVTLKTLWDKESFTLTLGPDLKDPELISFTADIDGDKTTIKYEADEENNSGYYGGSLTVKEGKNTVFSASLSWDKSSGDFSIKSEDLRINGNLIRKGKTLTLSLSRANIFPSYYSYRYGYDMNALIRSFTFTMKESDSMPSQPKYTDILGFTRESEMDKFVETIESNAEDLAYSLQDLFY